MTIASSGQTQETFEDKHQHIYSIHNLLFTKPNIPIKSELFDWHCKFLVGHFSETRFQQKFKMTNTASSIRK